LSGSVYAGFKFPFHQVQVLLYLQAMISTRKLDKVTGPLPCPKWGWPSAYVW